MFDFKINITKEKFKKMCFWHIQEYYNCTILSVETNLMMNVEYIEGYDEYGEKSFLFVIFLDECMEERWLKALESGYDNYIIYSYSQNQIEELLKYLTDDEEALCISESLKMKILGD